MLHLLEMQLDHFLKNVILKKMCINKNPVKQYRKLFTKLINKKTHGKLQESDKTHLKLNL